MISDLAWHQRMARGQAKERLAFHDRKTSTTDEIAVIVDDEITSSSDEETAVTGHQARRGYRPLTTTEGGYRHNGTADHSR